MQCWAPSWIQGHPCFNHSPIPPSHPPPRALFWGIWRSCSFQALGACLWIYLSFLLWSFFPLNHIFAELWLSFKIGSKRCFSYFFLSLRRKVISPETWSWPQMASSPSSLAQAMNSHVNWKGPQMATAAPHRLSLPSHWRGSVAGLLCFLPSPSRKKKHSADFHRPHPARGQSKENLFMTHVTVKSFLWFW